MRAFGVAISIVVMLAASCLSGCFVLVERNGGSTATVDATQGGVSAVGSEDDEEDPEDNPVEDPPADPPDEEDTEDSPVEDPPPDDPTIDACSDEGALTSEPFANSEYADGSEADPYLICAAPQLVIIGTDTSYWSKSFVLGDDIDLSGYAGADITPIGVAGGGASLTYTGVFDGNNRVITNLTSTNGGLFGQISGTVRNLKLTDVSVTRDEAFPGGLANSLINGALISNVLVTGTVFGANSSGGLLASGVLATSDSVTIEDVVVSGSVDFGTRGEEGWGGAGLLGYASCLNGFRCLIRRTAVVNVEVSGTACAGIVQSASGLDIEDSYFSGVVNCDSRAGGISGLFEDSTVTNVYVVGSVTATIEEAAGLLAIAREGVVVGQSWVSADVSGIGGANRIIKTDLDATTVVDNATVIFDSDRNCTNCEAVDFGTPQSGAGDYFFDSASNPNNAWDFTSTWQELEGDYPILVPTSANILSVMP